MIIEYVRERGYDGVGKDPSLTLKKKYMVLGWDIFPNAKLNRVCIRRDSDGYPVSFDEKWFNLTEGSISTDWNFAKLESGAYRLGPIGFAGDFWDRFHDGDEEAELLFEQEYRKIVAFHKVSAT